MSIELHCDDIRNVLPVMREGSVDCIVTDPPYRTIGGGKGKPGDGSPSGMLASNDTRIFVDNDLPFHEYMRGLYYVLRDPGHMYLMVNFLNLEVAMQEVRSAGFGIHNLLVARKQNATPNRWGMKNCEYTILARKGRAFALNDCGFKTCHDWTNPVGEKSHPTEKSVDLMANYVMNSTKSGETVFDPFMGTGATGVAAIDLERNFVGVEMNPAYYLTAMERIHGKA